MRINNRKRNWETTVSPELGKRVLMNKGHQLLKRQIANNRNRCDLAKKTQTTRLRKQNRQVQASLNRIPRKVSRGIVAGMEKVAVAGAPSNSVTTAQAAAAQPMTEPAPRTNRETARRRHALEMMLKCLEKPEVLEITGEAMPRPANHPRHLTHQMEQRHPTRTTALPRAVINRPVVRNPKDKSRPENCPPREAGPVMRTSSQLKRNLGASQEKTPPI